VLKVKVQITHNNNGVNDYKKKVTPEKELCCLICFVLRSAPITSKEANN